jgi:DNA-binding transcriptional ArsR family regulator
MAKTAESLARLICSGKCNCQNVGDYTDELKQLAKKDADRGSAKKRSKLFKALGDETRQRILALLSIREMCVCELITALDMTQPTTSHHLKILEDVDLLESRKEGKWVFYRISDQKRVSRLIELAT